VKKSELTQERLRELLRYDPKTGEFRWRAGKKPNPRAGRIAGCRQQSDSWSIRIDGRRYQAHQLAWLYMRGEWGRPVIDHRDGNPLNNRWSNLRLSTYSDNAANRGRMRSNTSGFKGAVFDPRTDKWRALISKDGRRYCLGRYATAEEAHAAYVAKALELFGEFARAK
jgi:HNH endonuclease/AP2 domain